MPAHLIQPFLPGEVSFEEAHQIGQELTDKVLEGKYSYVVSVHIDKDHVHITLYFVLPIIWSMTNIMTARSVITGQENCHSWRNRKISKADSCQNRTPHKRYLAETVLFSFLWSV